MEEEEVTGWEDLERRIGRTWGVWRKLCARTLRLVHFSLDQSVPCSSTNGMPRPRAP